MGILWNLEPNYFELNRYGSYDFDLGFLQNNEYYHLENYPLRTGGIGTKYELEKGGEDLYKKKVKRKLEKIFSEQEIDDLKETIHHLSTLSASEISEDEHEKLLVDSGDRHKLLAKARTVHIEMLDLMEEMGKIPSETLAQIRLRALIEYGFHLSKYLQKKFEKLGDRYDHGAYMSDYYLLKSLDECVKFIEDQIKSGVDNETKINRYYQYIINFSKGRYPFSLDNPKLGKIISA